MQRGGRTDGHRVDAERVVYGRHPVRELVRAGRRRVLRVFATRPAIAGLEIDLASLPVTYASHEDIASRAGSDDHQGIVAVVEPYPYVDADDVLAVDGALAFCLDGITDPRNLGAIARICDAVGATGIVIPRHRTAVVTAVVCKTSAGAVEHLPIARCTNLADTLERAKSAALWIYGASERGERVYTDVDVRGGVAYVLGAEGKGLRPRVAATCDELVRIPMRGHVASLNVATAAAVLGYEAVRQHGD